MNDRSTKIVEHDGAAQKARRIIEGVVMDVASMGIHIRAIVPIWKHHPEPGKPTRMELIEVSIEGNL